MTMKAITASNVLGADQYKAMVREVMEFAGKTVSRTIGPCANTSIIEEMGPLVASKDGFHTMKRIQFAPSDTFARNIMDVIVKMSHRMVSLVGDGSSSAVVAAWKFSRELNNSNVKSIRPRELNKIVNETIKEITTRIQENATVASAEELPEVMYHTALVSTNGDEKFAKMVREIYEVCKNNVRFNIVKGTRNEEETTYKVVDGYKSNYYYMIDPVFHNRGKGEFEAIDAHVICFDMAIDQYHMPMIDKLYQLAVANDDPYNPREVIVIAPSYSQDFLDLVRGRVTRENQLINAKQIRHYTVRYAKCLTVNKFQRNEYMDFCMLVGSRPIASTDFNSMINIITSENTLDEKESEDRLRDAIGGVGHIRTHMSDYMIIDGFTHRDDALFEKTMMQVKAVYEELYAENINAPYPSQAFIHQRNRYRKLLCKMVEIVVGGENEFERSLQYDAIDDATHACESVANFGYNIGGNIAILIAVNDLINKHSNDKLRVEVLKVIYATFVATVAEVFANKYTGDGFDSLSVEKQEEIEKTIGECVNRGTYYDLIAGDFSDKIINSCRTDIEILNGALSLSLTLLTANQYVSNFPNVENN